jgi:hypothetical protein
MVGLNVVVQERCTVLTNTDNRDQLVKSRDSGLSDAIKTQNSMFGKVRQTADAVVDSRFFVNISDLASKKLNNSLGNSGVGIDLDQFVSKCIYFMKSGGHIAGEEDAPAVPVSDDDDNEDPDGLDWALLGRKACFPCNKRPPTSSFLLGPLSVQKKVRITQRKARSQRQPLGPATRPEEIKEGDIEQNEQTNLSNLVKGIRSQLEAHLEQGMLAVEEELEDIPDDELDDESQVAAFRRHRMAMSPDQEAAVSLVDFAINPRDFGQTVENLFYISFLVREGNAKIIQDDDGLPLLSKSLSSTCDYLLTNEQYLRILMASPNNGRTASKSIKLSSVSTIPRGRCSLRHSISRSRLYHIARTNMAMLARTGGTPAELSNRHSVCVSTLQFFYNRNFLPMYDNAEDSGPHDPRAVSSPSLPFIMASSFFFVDAQS